MGGLYFPFCQLESETFTVHVVFLWRAEDWCGWQCGNPDTCCNYFVRDKSLSSCTASHTTRLWPRSSCQSLNLDCSSILTFMVNPLKRANPRPNVSSHAYLIQIWKVLKYECHKKKMQLTTEGKSQDFLKFRFKADSWICLLIYLTSCVYQPQSVQLTVYHLFTVGNIFSWSLI